MEVIRFDTIAKLLASRKTRRAAVGSGLGIAGAALTGRALAQEGTPAATPSIDLNDPHPSADDAHADPEFLFVQPFDSGEWAPKTGEEGTYVPTLTGAAANTIYFSDRPERIVGLWPTQDFLEGLGFTPANPPNAAIVASREGSEEQEILVIELLNPVYDESNATLTYDARVLADYGEHGLAHLARQQQDYELAESFGAGSLFIDGILDCDSETATCIFERDDGSPLYVGEISLPMCSTGGVSLNCAPCRDPKHVCAEQYPDQCLYQERDAQGNLIGEGYMCDVRG